MKRRSALVALLAAMFGSASSGPVSAQPPSGKEPAGFDRWLM